MDSDVNRCPIGLFTLDAFNINTKFLAITLDNLANLLAFVVTTYNLDFVVFANGDISENQTRVRFVCKLHYNHGELQMRKLGLSTILLL